MNVISSVTGMKGRRGPAASRVVRLCAFAALAAASAEYAVSAEVEAPSNATKGTAEVNTPPNSKAEGSYSLGVSMGDQLRRLGISADMLATERLSQGLRDALAGKAEMSQQHQEQIAQLVQSARATAGDKNKAAARSFLAENGKKKGVVTTESGLQYKVIEPGKGESPKAADEVTVHYTGTLLDGSEFDSSVRRGEPASFPVNGVIQGWQEALVLMKPGAKWELYIPPELAYDVNSPPAIPPGSLLKFEVELLSVEAAQ